MCLSKSLLGCRVFQGPTEEFGQANNEGPRKRKWDNSVHGGHGGHGHHVETSDTWKAGKGMSVAEVGWVLL